MPRGQMGDTGRQWRRCKLKIGSNIHPKQIFRVCLGIDQRDSQMGTASRSACSPKSLITEPPVTRGGCYKQKVKGVSLTVCSRFEEGQLSMLHVSLERNCEASNIPHVKNEESILFMSEQRQYNLCNAFHVFGCIWL